MKKDSSYSDYARQAVEEFSAKSERERNLLVAQIDVGAVKKVLDVGCGAGQELLPFAKKTAAFCVGVDVGAEVGEIGRETFRRTGFDDRAAFFRARGENLPFAEASFDIVICRVALPYMNNRKSLAEISRVLKSGGKFFLKIHAAQFYFGMLLRRLKTFNPKQLAYPMFSLIGGSWNILSGKQPGGAFWNGKEIFQTENFLQNQLEKNNLQIVKTMPDTNPQTPSYLIEKLR